MDMSLRLGIDIGLQELTHTCTIISMPDGHLGVTMYTKQPTFNSGLYRINNIKLFNNSFKYANPMLYCKIDEFLSYFHIIDNAQLFNKDILLKSENDLDNLLNSSIDGFIASTEGEILSFSTNEDVFLEKSVISGDVIDGFRIKCSDLKNKNYLNSEKDKINYQLGRQYYYDIVKRKVVYFKSK